MDDCNLEKLNVKPGKLNPSFKKDTKDYNVTVASSTAKITFECLTSDSGASYNISGSDGSKNVPLEEGKVNEVKIEVTAEDGTTKVYLVHIKRLSAKDATLSELKLQSGQLKPEFTPDVKEYYSDVACNTASLIVTASVPDAKSDLTINGKKSGAAHALSLGVTKLVVEVSSPDGSTKENYVVHVTRKQLPRYVQLKDPAQAMKYECPITLAPVYCPVTIKDGDSKHTFSAPVLDEITKTSKVNPLNDMPLLDDWRIVDYAVDEEISQVLGYVPQCNGEDSEVSKLSEISTLFQTAVNTLDLRDVASKFETNVPLVHEVKTRDWERQLQQIFDESNPANLVSLADNSLQKYFAALPLPGRKERYPDGESPLDFLQQATHCIATAIKGKVKDASLHLRLGFLMEEKYYAEDTMGIIKDQDSGAGAASNIQARESSKAEECAAICQLRGVGPGSPLPVQLKAIDEEYHHLLEGGQSHRADHVMGLYAWKSKQATQEGLAASKATDDRSSLGQATVKYLDALKLDETKAAHHFHVGRMLVVQGQYDEAVDRLQAALAWNSKDLMSRFYLGMALSLRKAGPGARAEEAIRYLLEGLDALLQLNTEEALQEEESPRKPVLQAEGLLQSSNVYLLRGIIQLGKLRKKAPEMKNVMAHEAVFHNAALLACQTLPRIAKGDIYGQVEWVLLEAHSQLLETLLETKPDNIALISQRCERLSALIKGCSIPVNAELLALRQKTSQMLVETQPCGSHALCMLGNAQLSGYDNDPEAPSAGDLLNDAKRSFRGSIALEGSPPKGDPSAFLTEQTWWQAKVKANEAKQVAAAADSNKKGPGTVTKGGPGVPRGGAATRGAASAKGGAAAPRGGTAAKSGGAAVTRGTPTARGAGASRGGAAARGAPVAAATAARGGSSATRGRGSAAATRGGTGNKALGKGPAAAATKGPAVRPGSGPKKTLSQHSCNSQTTSATKRPTTPVNGETTKGQDTVAAQKKESTVTPGQPAASAVVNKSTYHPRLGLARALSRTPDGLTEAMESYRTVIEMAPQIHDAYIESADLVVKTDPLAAVDIYTKFPLSDSISFDDAYIFGEIVRLLMKCEQFDDPRLGPSLVAMGKVLGIGALEKYVDILDGKYKTELLKSVYAGVNGKAIDDPDMMAFFKFKCWM